MKNEENLIIPMIVPQYLETEHYQKEFEELVSDINNCIRCDRCDCDSGGPW